MRHVRPRISNGIIETPLVLVRVIIIVSNIALIYEEKKEGRGIVNYTSVGIQAPSIHRQGR